MMKKASPAKPKKTTSKGKAKQDSEAAEIESNEMIDLHPLHTQGNASDGKKKLVGGELESPLHLGNSIGVAGLNLEDISSPSSVSTPVMADDELFLDRYIKQTTGASGKVAYVVFNGLSPGVFYNWISCSNSMAGMDDRARRFLGFYTYDDAHNAWALYEQHGVLPQGVPPISLEIKQHAEDLRNKMISTVNAQRQRAINNQQSPTSPVEGPSKRRTAIKKSLVVFEKHPETPTPTVRFQLPASPNPPNPPPSTDDIIGNRFWVVFQGPEPGVHRDQISAMRALGGRNMLNDNYMIAPSLSAANSLFVQYYMLGLVSRWDRN
ncbi:hypothetical protein HYPSUDRAFT_56731 [Hypholoma sublateritium FD-334 SS-4]|uniref:Ribonuclease H1 N-terminal domain-containing protein n=1 Tax=Hypholoma sublateritium (strain FD-334 SS-4) TaxID=945553 RepID=A0A0D2NK05_HYPSF|nr:hypothetical protein HYPSUDRAFT_56731 [Hypholoma sublateritium FD-334 SS-4]